jgi:serine/threonine protein kinase
MQPPSSPAGQLAVDEFCRKAVRSGLVSSDELQIALHALPPSSLADAPALAEQLIRTGKLTRFQARKLLAGRSRGLVLGAYQILSHIGKGGTGAVFLARDGRNDQLVALKILLPSQVEERVRARFLREMELGRLVEHPHVVRTFETGHLQGVDYIAMEFIPGKSLHRLVSTEGPLSLDRAAAVFAEVADALEHAHSRGLVHRDLKPGNIMVTPHGHAKLLDLGLALRRGEKADRSVVGGQGYIVGTMDYIAPEQTVDALQVDARSDLYSLGCTLYYALTGQPPFAGGDRREKILRQRTQAPPSLLELRPDLPPAFAVLVQRLMAKNPDDRFPSAAAAAAAVRSWALGEILPLDRPEDETFVAEVAALRNADTTLDETPLEIASVAEADALAGAAQGLSPNSQPRKHFSHIWITGLVIVLTGLVVVSLGIVALLLSRPQ